VLQFASSFGSFRAASNERCGKCLLALRLFLFYVGLLSSALHYVFLSIFVRKKFSE
jgi:hypothetical protein